MIVILIETIKDRYQTRLAKDGGTVRTIRGGCDYMTGMGKQRELRSHWQRVCKLILAKTDVVAVSRALELALAPRSRMALARFRRKTAQVTAHSPARGSALIEIAEAVRAGVTPLACVSCDHIVLCTSHNIGCLHERRKKQSPQVPRLELRAL